MGFPWRQWQLLALHSILFMSKKSKEIFLGIQLIYTRLLHTLQNYQSWNCPVKHRSNEFLDIRKLDGVGLIIGTPHIPWHWGLSITSIHYRRTSQLHPLIQLYKSLIASQCNLLRLPYISKPCPLHLQPLHRLRSQQPRSHQLFRRPQLSRLPQKRRNCPIANRQRRTPLITQK